MRNALIVACSKYADSGLAQLRAPAHDARALAEVLEDPEIGGFTVSLVLDQPEATVRREVARFFANRSPEDTLLAHFSCHGVKDENGELYFAANDTELLLLAATALPADFVNDQMAKSRSRRIVLLLDCCYSGAFARGMQHRAGQGVELHRFQGRGRAVLTASSAVEYAFEGNTLTRDDGSPSVFTSAVVQGLRTGDADRDGDGRISVDELYNYVFDEVRRRTPSQHPHRWSFDFEGDLFVATAAPPSAAMLPPELRDAMANLSEEARLKAVNQLSLLLAGRDRRRAAAARDALEILPSVDYRRSVQEAVAAVLSADAIRTTQDEGVTKPDRHDRSWPQDEKEKLAGKPARVRRRWSAIRTPGTTWWALIPILTVGLGAPPILLYLALRLRRTWLWVVFSCSAAATVAGYVLVSYFGSPGTTESTSTIGSSVGFSLVWTSAATASAIAFAFRSKVLRTQRGGAHQSSLQGEGIQ